MNNNLPAIQSNTTPMKAFNSGNKVSELPQKEASKWLNQTLSAAVAMAQQEINPPAMMALIQGTMDMLNKRFKLFTADEVLLAIKNGVYGYYGDYYKITIKEIGKWLGTYQTGERSEIIRRLESEKLQETLKAHEEMKPPKNVSETIARIRKNLTSKS